MVSWFQTMLNGKRSVLTFWDAFLFVKRTFTAGENINIPADKVLQMHSPTIEGELYIDGEAYIL